MNKKTSMLHKIYSTMKVNIDSQSIIDYRKKNNWSQEELAIKAGVTLVELQKIENGGKFLITDKSLNKLAEFLDEDQDD